MIFDEIQAGLGRTGRLWACDHWNTAPDILCLAKGIAGGVPMGATLVRPDILASMSKENILQHSEETLFHVLQELQRYTHLPKTV